jgi:hypothetical protein
MALTADARSEAPAAEPAAAPRTRLAALLLLFFLLDAEVAVADNKKSESSNEPGTTEMCIDQAIAEKLAVKRKRRGAVDRLFVKQSRHEMTVTGGYYASDLFSGTYVVGGAYTYHMTDQTAVEFGGGWTHANELPVRRR